MSDEPKVLYRFTGGDPPTAWYVGVPARDLTTEDWADLGPRERADVEANKALYERVATVSAPATTVTEPAKPLKADAPKE